ncbi:hypothetical protein PhCBS80983_g01320 [Powellomyces hirtus]|uniref:Protein kinase domain-containing protein n=1 Tax=Powellomyces hirtus TaxID=109895 RepID=A0A507ED39_9FUNG|nr:hypothetical protein PhCBS80983_g01320 [Powellomyces hirtus]
MPTLPSKLSAPPRNATAGTTSPVIPQLAHLRAGEHWLSQAPTGPLPPLPPDTRVESDVKGWDESRVGTWLTSIGFERFASAFADHHITGDVITELNYETLKDVGVVSVGDRARILQAIKKDLRGVRSIGTQVGPSTLQTDTFSNITHPAAPSSPANLVASSTASQRSQAWELQTMHDGTPESPSSPTMPSPTLATPHNHMFRSMDRTTSSPQFTGPETAETLGRPDARGTPRGPVKPAFSVPDLIHDIAGRVPKRKGSLTGAAIAIERIGPSPLLIAPRSTSIKSATLDRSQYSQSQLQSAGSGSFSANGSVSAGGLTERSEQTGRDQSATSTSPNTLFSFRSGLSTLDEDRKSGKDKFQSSHSKEGSSDSAKLKTPMSVEGILAKCVRVNGVDNQSHIIQVADLPDITAIKHRIFNKFGLKDAREREMHGIFAPDFVLEDDEDLYLVDDDELFRLCKSRNPNDAMTKNQLHLCVLTSDGIVHKSSVDKNVTPRPSQARPGEIQRTESQDSLDRTVAKAHRFFGERPPQPAVQSQTGSMRRAPDVMLQARSTSPHSPRSKPPIPDEFSQPQQRSKKLAEFFGERPPDELIVDQLEQFFPGIAKKTSPLPPTPVGNASVQNQNQQPQSPSAQGIPLIVPPRRDASKDTIKRRVHAAMLNKRISKVAHRGSAFYARRGSDVTSMKNSPMGSAIPSVRDGVEPISEVSEPAFKGNQALIAESLKEEDVSGLPTSRQRNLKSLANKRNSTRPLEDWPEALATLSYLSSVAEAPPPDSEESTLSPTPYQQNKPLPSPPAPTPSPMTVNFPQVPTPAPRGVRVSQFFGSNGSPPPPHHPPPQQPLPPQPSSLSTSTTGEPNSPTTPPVTPFKWELGKLIGQGAFGKVFIGLNFDTGELMAVKQVERHILADPTKKSSNDPARKKREDALRREIDFLKDLEHPHIVRCLGSEILETTFNVFLEYISGGSVSSCLNRYGAFEEHIVKCMTAQILCGLEFLHEKSIIHRDIKGANILVDAEGIVKISDFGISKKNEYREAYHRVTRMSMQGSIPWMAPEVARGKGYSAKVDIWSLGCLVLEMLTSQTPWHKARGNVIYLLGTGNAPPLPGTLTPASRSFIEQCFKIDPELRPTATDLLLGDAFTDVEDPLDYNFREWVERATAAKAARERESVMTGYTSSSESLASGFSASYESFAPLSGSNAGLASSPAANSQESLMESIVKTAGPGIATARAGSRMSMIPRAPPSILIHEKEQASLSPAAQQQAQEQQQQQEPSQQQQQQQAPQHSTPPQETEEDDFWNRGADSYVDKYLSTDTLDEPAQLPPGFRSGTPTSKDGVVV